MKKVIIGSRGSDLALWQANHVKNQLEALGLTVEIKVVKTQGDVIQHLSFDKMEGKGFFTKEIEAALLEKSIDIAVHSHKDLETRNPEGLGIAAVSEREDPAELLLIRKESVDKSKKLSLKANPIVGTSSARRKSQLITFRDDIELKDLRGNVPTRINKLREGNYDAILLAKAGVSRLNINLDDLEVVSLDPTEFIPAPAQGALGIQIRQEDKELASVLSNINDIKTQKRINLEREVLRLLDGGCQLPLGVYCPNDSDVYVSFAHKWEKGAIFKRYNIDNPRTIASNIVAELNNI